MPIGDEFDNALREASLCVDQLRDQDEPFWSAVAIGTIGTFEVETGRLDEALPHLQKACDMSRQLDSPWLGVSWSQLGAIAIMQHRFDDARVLLDQGLDMSSKVESVVGIALCLAGYARLALASGTPDRAAVILGAAEGLRRRVGIQVWPTLRRSESALAKEIEQAMGADQFEDASAAGAGLTRHQAVAIVRDSGWERS